MDHKPKGGKNFTPANGKVRRKAPEP